MIGMNACWKYGGFLSLPASGFEMTVVGKGVKICFNYLQYFSAILSHW
ncbi:MAG TPA: hypothetical protein PKN32_10130 [Bacteroidales bacterium]|nr:hypothetical protein [Bacteroidales bacterium]